MRKKPIGEDYIKFRQEYEGAQGSSEKKAMLAEKHKIAPATIKQWYLDGATDPITSEASEIPEPIINLPSVKIREYKAPKRKRGDEEEAILHCSDGHADKVTESYDADVYRDRMDAVFDATMTIVTLHRKMYPIRKLHILATGDNTQGENPYQGSKVGTIRMGARDQTTKLAFPAWVRLIGSLAQEFEEIEVEGVGGNHSYSKLAPETSREDYRLYDLLRAYFHSNKRITINIHEYFSAIVNLNGFRCFVFHGDGIPCQQGVPFFALDKKLKSWYMQYGGFQYAFGGHFHKRHSDEISSRLEYFMCSTLVSDDDWALKQLGISSNPSQNIYGIHPRFGISWRYALQVDKKFLPEKEVKAKTQVKKVAEHIRNLPTDGHDKWYFYNKDLAEALLKEVE